MELALIKYIKANGLEQAIKAFNLDTRVYEHKIVLKYNMIDSPLGTEEAQDARGLILEKGTWRVMSLAFRKFFNAEEEKAAKIDWSTAFVLEKVDGSMIQVYWDWVKNEWFAGTTGMAEGEGEVNNKMGTSFSDLFWQTVEKVAGYTKEQFTKRLVKGNTYAFELTTPYNIVVTPHATSSVTLLTVRSLLDLTELSYEASANVANVINVPMVKRFSLQPKDFGELKRTFEGMPFTEEGYVVVDGNFKRVKCKNPAYVAVHHLKSKTGEHNILEVVKSNEIDEFAATFPERKDEIYKLHANYLTLLTELEATWVELQLRLPKNITPAEKKRFAEAVFEVTKRRKLDGFTGLMFNLKDGKTTSVRDYMKDYDNRRLYKIL